MGSKTKGAIKCHKCRHVLFEDINNIYVNVAKDKAECCSSYDINHFIYLHEEHLPSWISKIMEEVSWTKGKLHCEKCGSKVGTFDYTYVRRCECGKSELPCIYFVTSQVDRPIVM